MERFVSSRCLTIGQHNGRSADALAGGLWHNIAVQRLSRLAREPNERCSMLPSFAPCTAALNLPQLNQ
jgi:hypothetical protein